MMSPLELGPSRLIISALPEPDGGEEHRDVVLLAAEHVEPVGRGVLREGRQEVRILQVNNRNQEMASLPLVPMGGPPSAITN